MGYEVAYKLYPPEGPIGTPYDDIPDYGFGSTVAMSQDGSVIAVAQRIWENGDINTVGRGRVLVYSGSNHSTITELYPQGTLLLRDPRYYGWSLAISGDGSTILVGDPYNSRNNAIADTDKGKVYLRTGEGWANETQIVSSDIATNDTFGFSLALNFDGSVAVVGTGGARAAYVYSGANHATETILTAGSAIQGFGSNVAVNDDGDVVVVGSPMESSNAGALYVFTGSSWGTRTRLAPADLYANDFLGGTPFAISGDGSTIIAGATETGGFYPGDGHAYVFSGPGFGTVERMEPTFEQTEAGLRFGFACGVSSDGEVYAVSAPAASAGVGSPAGRTTVYGDGEYEWVDGEPPTTGEWLGEALAFSADGEVMVLGSYTLYEGLPVYERSAGYGWGLLL